MASLGMLLASKPPGRNGEGAHTLSQNGIVISAQIPEVWSDWCLLKEEK